MSLPSLRHCIKVHTIVRWVWRAVWRSPTSSRSSFNASFTPPAVPTRCFACFGRSGVALKCSGDTYMVNCQICIENHHCASVAKLFMAWAQTPEDKSKSATSKPAVSDSSIEIYLRCRKDHHVICLKQNNTWNHGISESGILEPQSLWEQATVPPYQLGRWYHWLLVGWCSCGLLWCWTCWRSRAAYFDPGDVWWMRNNPKYFLVWTMIVVCKHPK